MSENGKRRSYDRAFKVEAVRLVTEQRRRVIEVARKLAVIIYAMLHRNEPFRLEAA